jgi:hypothetical protein
MVFKSWGKADDRKQGDMSFFGRIFRKGPGQPAAFVPKLNQDSLSESTDRPDAYPEQGRSTVYVPAAICTVHGWS